LLRPRVLSDLEGGLDLQLIDHFFELAVGLVTLGFCIADCFAQRFELRFLFIELPGVTLQQCFFLGTSAQGFHVFAQPALVFNDAVDVLLPVFHFLFELGHRRFLVHDFL
jgi:hypothetical protein